jgi:hypothetical protein
MVKGLAIRNKKPKYWGSFIQYKWGRFGKEWNQIKGRFNLKIRKTKIIN